MGGCPSGGWAWRFAPRVAANLSVSAVTVRVMGGASERPTRFGGRCCVIEVKRFAGLDHESAVRERQRELLRLVRPHSSPSSCRAGVFQCTAHVKIIGRHFTKAVRRLPRRHENAPPLGWGWGTLAIC